MHQEQTAGPGFQNLQENTKHGLHFRSYYQLKNVTIAAESYREGTEPYGDPQLSRQKLIPRGKENYSRHKEKTHGKTKNLTVKRKHSRQKEKDPRKKEKTHGKEKRLTANRCRITSLLFLRKYKIFSLVFFWTRKQVHFNQSLLNYRFFCRYGRLQWCKIPP